MKILIACEYSGRVRDAFLAKGHDAMSCDLLPTESPGPHYQGDVMDIINNGWDMMIAFPPCTYLTTTGNKWMKPEFRTRFPDRPQRRKDAIKFFIVLATAKIGKIAVENPVGIMSSEFKKPNQIIQPYYFGDEARKTTCLWLSGLPQLKHYENDTLFNKKTHVGQGEMHTYKNGWQDPKWHMDTLRLPPEERAKARSLTYPGIANAMAEQWT